MYFAPLIMKYRKGTFFCSTGDMGDWSLEYFYCARGGFFTDHLQSRDTGIRDGISTIFTVSIGEKGAYTASCNEVMIDNEINVLAVKRKSDLQVASKKF